MHLGIYWHLQGQSTAATPANDALKEALKGYSWFRPIGEYFVVQVGGESDRQLIRSRLREFAEANPGAVRYVITPVMQGQYVGWLPGDVWPKIKERTGE